MRFKPYPKYKPSGVEWLGDVPEEWHVVPLKRDVEFVTSGSRGWAEHYADDGDIFLRIGNLTSDSVDLDLSDIQYVAVPKGAEGERTKVQPGDLLVSITANLGSVAVAPPFMPLAYVSQHVALVRPLEKLLHSRWCAYVVLSDIGKTHYVRQGYGGTKVQLSLEDVRSTPIPVPTFKDQHVIATFLDRETAKIDTLINKQEKLIELLKEKRQAVISHAVTKGLDPTVPTKDSGVEWLGDVPAHWKVCSFRHCASIAEGQVDPKDEKFKGIVLIAPNHVESGTGRIIFTETAGDQEAISGKYQVRAGDVVYSKIRPSLNKVCMAMEDCLCSADMYPIRTGIDLLSQYLHALMLSAGFVKFMTEESARVAMPKVNRETVTACKVPLPPVSEQQHIVDHLGKAIAKIDALIAKAEQAIALQKEHRTALISAAVTGKIDVRNEIIEKEVA